MTDRDETRTRTAVIHRTYTDRLPMGSPIDPATLGQWLDLYRHMVTARLVDRSEADLTARGLAFFHCPCGGHEGMAAVASLLTSHDWLHLHYRDKALLLARGVPPSVLFHNLLVTADSPSAGRQMTPFVGDPERNILCQNVPVGNHVPQAVGVASAVLDRPGRPIVVCSMGDGATQEGEVLEAIAEAVRRPVPVLFLVEDNGLSVSTRTAGRTFYSLPDWCEPADRLFGLPIHRLDGRDPVALQEGLSPIVTSIRSDRRPALAIVSVDRLTSHTNADDDRVYRSPDEMALARHRGDPVANLRRRLIDSGVAPAELDRVEALAEAEVREAVEQAMHAPEPEPVTGAKAPLPSSLSRDDPSSESKDSGEGDRLTMLEAIREVLRERLETDPRVSLFGQDIEDPKGDVFGVTRGLSTDFPDRVRNAPLAESTIVGSAIGRAMAGDRPVAFLQFADFLPLAYNQIHSEMGSLYWRSAGSWSSPVILMVACGGYRPGLGPFHAQTMEAIASHVPGVDVFMPSTAADAAGLLNAAFESGRPTIFFYPKIALNDRDRATSADVSNHRVPIGRARRLRSGDDLTLVAWGACVPIAEQVADALAEQREFGIDVLDLRSLSPWDHEAVRESARRTGRLLVLHEDNRSCGLGAEILADVAESVDRHVRCRRITRPDTYIPCHFPSQLHILPSVHRTMEAAADLLDLALTWERPPLDSPSSAMTIEARGPSPADETVTVLSWKIKQGQEVRAGDVVAEMVADKAVFDFVAPTDGRVSALIATEGQPLRVGAPLLQLEATDAKAPSRRHSTREEPGRPVLRRRSPRVIDPKATDQVDATITLSVPAVAFGSTVVTNEDIIHHFPGRSIADIRKRTGIESRRRIGPGESALTMAVEAARQAVGQAGVSLSELDTVICCTGTPGLISPSLACRVLHALSEALGVPSPEVPAFDLNAACSGFLYAMAAAYDFTRSRPDARVLVVTSEALSTLIDSEDFDTAILFGDAASATIVSGPEAPEPAGSRLGRLRRPILSTRAEPGEVLRVPTEGNGFIAMDGLRVYAEAVRRMIGMLDLACEEAGIPRDSLDLIVPHQANARIIHDVRMRLKLPADRMFLNLQRIGNTSSSSIPVALAEIAHRPERPRSIGLTAFGSGYTFASAILQTEQGNDPHPIRTNPVD